AGARATNSMPVEPPAPALFSTTMDWPSSRLPYSATRRAARSVEPPGAKGTISLTGRFGYGAWAWALASTSAALRARAARSRAGMGGMNGLLLQGWEPQRREAARTEQTTFSAGVMT